MAISRLSRVLKWAFKFALIALLVALVASLLILQWLPGLLERQALRRLRAAGLPAAHLHIESADLHRLKVTGLSISDRTWQVWLREGTANYRPLELVRPEIRSVKLDDLQVEIHLDSPPAPGTAPWDLDSWREWANTQPSQLPLRSLSVEGGLFRLDRGQQDIELPFELDLTNDPASRILHINAGGGSGQSQLQFDAQWDRREGLHAFGQIQLSDGWNPWLTLVRPGELPSSFDGFHPGPANVTLDLAYRPEGGILEISGEIPHFEAQVTNASAVLDRTQYHAQLRNDGNGELRVDTTLMELRHSNLRVTADTISLASPDLQTLESTVRQFNISGPEGLEAKADFDLAAAGLREWPNLRGSLDFHVHSLGLDGIRIEPFYGKLEGSRAQLDLAISSLEVESTNGTTLRVTDLKGVMVNPLERLATLTLAGQFQGFHSSGIKIREPITFAMEGRRGRDNISASLRLDLTNASVRLPFNGEARRLSGTASTSATFQSDQSVWQMSLNSTQAEIVVAGLTVRQGSISTRATLVTPPEVGSPPHDAVSSWLEGQLPGISRWLGSSGFELSVGARSVDRSNAWQILRPSLHLRHSTSSGAPSGSLFEFGGRADSIAFQDFQISNAESAVEIMPNGARLKGRASLGAEPFNFHLSADWTAPTASGIAGDFSVGPVHLQAYQPPARWTGGKALQISGEIDANGRYRFLTGKVLDLYPNVRFSLEHVEEPNQAWVVEGIRGVLSGPWPGSPEAHSTNRIHVDRLGVGKFEVRDLVLNVSSLGTQTLQVQLEDAHLLDGQARTSPFLWDLKAGKMDALLDVERVNLATLAKLIPHFAGSIEGEIYGRVPIHFEAGKFALGATTLQLSRNRPARLRYPAEGLLTAGSAPGSERYQQLKLIENALQDLRLSDLTVRLHAPGQPQTPIRLRLEGTFTSAEAVIPVRLNLNINGDLDQVIRLLSLGDVELFL